jgi:hypothetical protein
MKFSFNEINQEKCASSGQPLPSNMECPVNQNDALRCGLDDDFKIELFDHNRSQLNPDGTIAQPVREKSLGYHVVTREMI